MDPHWKTRIDFNRHLDEIVTPAYYAPFLGLDQVLSGLYDERPVGDVITLPLSSASTPTISKQINAQGGLYGNALQMALWQGHNKKVQILLDKRADINVQSSIYGNGLQEALSQGLEKVVEMLFSKEV